MLESTQVLVRPVISEKSYGLMDRGVYVFVVDERATKVDVRSAVESIFNVRVDRVNTLHRLGKTRRNRRTGAWGRRASTKRAYVILHPGDTIDLFES
jgi:large subunit ribosomal protein L23